MSEPPEDIAALRAQIETLRLTNAGLQKRLSADAERTDSILRELELKRHEMQTAHGHQEQLASHVQRIIDTLGNLVIVLDTSGYIIRANRSSTRYFGLSLANKTATLLDDWLEPAELRALRRALPSLPRPLRSVLLETARRCHQYRGEHQLRNADGKYYYFLLEATLLHNRQDQEEGVVVSATDITPMKKIETDLRLAASVFDNSLNGVTICDADTNIVRVNPAFTEILGYSQEECIGKQPRMLKSDIHEPGFFKNLWENLNKYGRWQGEIIDLHQDGHHVPIWQSITVVRDAKNAISHYIANFIDISVLKELQQKLNSARAAAEAASRAKSEFLANMSHEIRTPMNAIIGLSHLALRTALDPKQKDYLIKIHSAATSLLGIINDILDFSKIEAGKLTLEAIGFNIHAVVESVANVTSLHAAAKGIEILYSVHPSIPATLIGDPLRLGQVLLNLINNAIKFTHVGEVVVTIDLVEQQHDTATLSFTVRDTGIGMNEQQLSRLFHSFSQADTSTTRRFGGTGLGLTISNRLVQMMGSTISVTSVPDLGSTFCFHAHFGLRETFPATALPDATSLRGLRVLVVDDNATAREILDRTLSSWSMSVTTAAAGHAAIQLLEQASAEKRPYDLVLMDWQMPEMDGIETTRLIKTDQQISHTPAVFMLTSFGREEAIAQAAQLDIKAFLIKPISNTVLFDTIASVFNSARLPSPTILERKENTTLVAHAQGACVLVAEDNKINQQVAEELLTGYGLIVDIAGNGRIAVETLMRQPTRYAAVLMDIQMPEMDGLEATRQIRQWLGDTHLPIIAMTAHAVDTERQRCFDAGMDDHIAKPIDPDQLIRVLNQWIRPGAVTVPTPAPALPPSVESSETTLPERLPPFDIAAALVRVNGKRVLLKRLLLGFAEGYTNVAAEFRQMVATGAWEDARRLAHTVRGVAGSLEARELCNSARELESLCAQSSDKTAIYRVLESFEQHVALALAAVATLAKNDSCPLTTSTSTRKIDAAAACAIILDMQRLLDRKSMSVRKRFRALQDVLAGGGFDVELARIAQYLETLHFAAAHEPLHAIFTALHQGANEDG